MRWGEPDRRCVACDYGFRPCKGGGNKDCIKRNPLPSVLDIPIVVGRVELEIKTWIDRHGVPNDPVAHECVTMYRLRCLEHPGSKGSFNPAAIAFT
jgi:hypothetical protein